MRKLFILFLLFFLVGTLFVGLAGAQISTYKQNQSVPLTAVCNNCTYVNKLYPNQIIK